MRRPAQWELICASTKNTENGALDNFKLGQAKALRDLSDKSARTLIDSFEPLPAVQKAQNGPALVDTLLEAGHADLALPDMEKIEGQNAGDDSVKFPWTLAKAKAWRLKGNYAKAEKALSDAVADKNQPPARISDALLELAELKMAQGDVKAADKATRQAIEAYGKNGAAYVLLGRLFLKNGDTKQSVATARKALEINPYSFRAYMLLGDAQAAAGLLKDASVSYKKAAELYPGFLEAHKALLGTLRKLSLKDEAGKEEAQIAQMEKQR